MAYGQEDFILAYDFPATVHNPAWQENLYQHQGLKEPARPYLLLREGQTSVTKPSLSKYAEECQLAEPAKEGSC